tara:strand:- start:853 stop:1047 length:195 start_codon:yes stop_codon:yes gene_type:complete
MEYESLEEVICGRMSDLVDQLIIHQNSGDEILFSLVRQELEDLKSAASDEDYDFFFSTDHKFLN